MNVYCILLVLIKLAGYRVNGNGYVYPPAEPPFLFDEPISPPIPPPVYISPHPPLQDEIPQQIIPYLPPVYPPIGLPPLIDEIQPPLDDGVAILPSPPNQYLPPPSKQPQLKIINMSCLNSDSNGYFKTSFRIAPSSIFPIIDAAPSTCHLVPQSLDTFRLDLEGSRINECGVRSCGRKMCLNLRMAMVKGLRLADDPLVTLECIPQQTIVAHTKHLRLNTNLEPNRSGARSIPTIASGGNQKNFDVHVNLFRKSSNGQNFDQPLQQGSIVRLGDELMIRCNVQNDGWRYSRMGSVIIRSAMTQKSAILVDENGCRSPAMKRVCPQQPLQITPLTVQLPFRAFLFQGADSADDLLLSVRMIGCLHSRDCYQDKSCEYQSRIEGGRVSRAARNFTGTKTDNDEITGWESQLMFRVLPQNIPTDTISWSGFNSLITIVSVGALATLGCIIIISMRSFKR